MYQRNLPLVRPLSALELGLLTALLPCWLRQQLLVLPKVLPSPGKYSAGTQYQEPGNGFLELHTCMFEIPAPVLMFWGICCGVIPAPALMWWGIFYVSSTVFIDHLSGCTYIRPLGIAPHVFAPSGP
jgi:hypothetical protein